MFISLLKNNNVLIYDEAESNEHLQGFIPTESLLCSINFFLMYG